MLGRGHRRITGDPQVTLLQGSPLLESLLLSALYCPPVSSCVGLDLWELLSTWLPKSVECFAKRCWWNSPHEVCNSLQHTHLFFFLRKLSSILSLLFTWLLYDFSLWNPIDSLRTFIPTTQALFNMVISQSVTLLELRDDSVFDWSLVIIILKSK